MPKTTKAAASKQSSRAQRGGRAGGAATKKAAKSAVKKLTKSTGKATTKRAAGPAVTKATVSRRPAPKAAPAKKATAKKAATKTPAPKKAPAAGASARGRTARTAVPTKAPAKARPKKVVLDKFLEEQRAALVAEREQHIRQADVLQAEADRLAQDMEPGDVQFDEESGEGATMNVERERDLTLSAQARAAVDEIDRALAKIEDGTYGLCEQCGQPIPKPRLKALPYAALCVNCKSGGLSRR